LPLVTATPASTYSYFSFAHIEVGVYVDHVMVNALTQAGATISCGPVATTCDANQGASAADETYCGLCNSILTAGTTNIFQGKNDGDGNNWVSIDLGQAYDVSDLSHVRFDSSSESTAYEGRMWGDYYVSETAIPTHTAGISHTQRSTTQTGLTASATMSSTNKGGGVYLYGPRWDGTQITDYTPSAQYPYIGGLVIGDYRITGGVAEQAPADDAVPVLGCQYGDTTAILAACQCATGSTTNDCAVGKFCYDATCNDAAKA
jgi:hypothetical protein